MGIAKRLQAEPDKRLIAAWNSLMARWEPGPGTTAGGTGVPVRHPGYAALRTITSRRLVAASTATRRSRRRLDDIP